MTAVQESTEDRFQARIAGLLEAVVTGAPGIAYVIGGAITAIFDPRTAFAVAGGGVLVVLLAGVVVLRASRAARVRPVPAPAGESAA